MGGGGTELWQRLAGELAGQPRIARSTMMGLPCLRVDGAFFASLEPRSEELIVKLPRERVAELIAAGEGRPFSPAGKTFKEWVAVVGADRERWSALLAEAQRFGETAARPA